MSLQKHPDITRARIRNFKNEAPLWKQCYRNAVPVTLESFKAPGRIRFEEALRGTYRPVRIGHSFTPQWSTHWVRVQYTIPAEWQGACVHLLWDSSSEACVWKDGIPLQGLTGTGHPAWIQPDKTPIRSAYEVAQSARGGASDTLYIEVACNQFFGMDFTEASMGLLRQAEIAIFNPDAYALHLDVVTLAEIVENVAGNHPRGAQALYAANACLNVCDPDDPSTWDAARRIVRAFFAARNGGGQHRISAIGHAHIDTAWLWPIAETKRKCLRSFSSVLRLMERYPQFRFACSQAQQYDWIKQHHPAFYQEIKQQVHAGRFIPVGGTWIEPDCNVPSGESLVRQFLIGQRFFKQEFGRYCNGFWNPDVFGYNGQLPQIIRGAGMRWFLTQKLSWNQINKPDAHTFWWEGIDGSRVLTHFPPADTYNGVVNAKELLFNVSNYKDLDRSNESYYLFGYGDGGGGPTREMLERLERFQDVDGLPKIDVRDPDDFFTRLEQDAHPLVEKVGELYLEYHRGTLTTQAAVKRNNRRCEELLHDVEFLAAAYASDYPRKELDTCWKLLLLNQFHDIIPGSSIQEVYRDAADDYAQILRKGGALRRTLLSQIAGKKGPRWMAVNTIDAHRREVVDGPSDRPVLVEVAPYSATVCALESTCDASRTVRVRTGKNGVALENALLKVRIDRKGRLAELVDKRTGGTVLSAPGNLFALYDDHPNKFDAWDIDVFHLEKKLEEATATSVELVEEQPLRATVKVEYTLGARSRLTQWISLDAIAARVNFRCEADWQEDHRLLKVEYPTAIRAMNATYEMQFGHIERPTHFNSSQDLARFEVCAHRWADLSERGRGLALINDCKYGHSTHRGKMALTLLRAPTYPDPTADRGAHAFRYALIPHDGDWRSADIPRQAAAFNQPITLVPTKQQSGSPAESFIITNQPAVIVDTIKRAEEDDALIIRLYEAHGSAVQATVRTSCAAREAWETNLLEENQQPLKLQGDGQEWTLSFRPFEIKTIKVCSK